MPYGYFCNPVLRGSSPLFSTDHECPLFPPLHTLPPRGTDDFYLTLHLVLCRNDSFPGHITFPCLSDALSEFHKTGTPKKNVHPLNSSLSQKETHLTSPASSRAAESQKPLRSVYRINVWEVPSSVLKFLKIV